MQSNKFVKFLRWGLLALFTVLITTAAYLHQVNGGAKSPSIHALCPFGGLESFYQFFTAGTFIQKVFEGTMILFFITIAMAIVFRRSFCGLICPFGAIQEFFGAIGNKIFRKKFIIPTGLDKVLRYLKYVVLILTIGYAWKTAGLWMAPYDPWSAYAHFGEGLESVWEESAVGLILLGVTIIGSIVYDRFFCKYICPMGAFYAIIGKISPFKIERNKDVCIDCGKCSKVCPMNIDVQHTQKVTSAECINCQTCVLNCPKAGALEVKEAGKTVKPIVAIVLVMALFFGSIFLFQSLGMYKMLPLELKEGESISPHEIKGFMTIKDASTATKTELREFYKLFKIPETVPVETKMKEIVNLVPGYNYEKIKESLEGVEIKKEPVKSEASTSTATGQKISVEVVIGSMTITDAAKAVKVDVKEFYKLFKIPETVPDATTMKGISTVVPGYDFHKAKEALE